MAHLDWPDFGYSRDSFRYNERIIDGVPSMNYRLLGSGYTRDPWNTCFMGVSPLPFEPLGARAVDRYYCVKSLSDPFPPMRLF
ncbi:hypothetical protein I4U23_010536 [Adineta vaga]|nr:hypothetical protein I4U23_010536 [Adineta vaga]